MNQNSEHNFKKKWKNIKENPYTLRRTINKWPYYDTLNKIILQLINENKLTDIEILKNKYPILK